MNPAEYQPEGSLPPIETEKCPVPESGPVDKRPDGEILERVLRETLRSSDAAGEMQVLMRIGARHAGEVLSLHPITVELVHSLLSFRFRRLASPDRLQQMSRAIAETLWNDPRVHGRLELFWSKLSHLSSKR